MRKAIGFLCFCFLFFIIIVISAVIVISFNPIFEYFNTRYKSQIEHGDNYNEYPQVKTNHIIESKQTTTNTDFGVVQTDNEYRQTTLDISEHDFRQICEQYFGYRRVFGFSYDLFQISDVTLLLCNVYDVLQELYIKNETKKTKYVLNRMFMFEDISYNLGEDQNGRHFKNMDVSFPFFTIIFSYELATDLIHLYFLQKQAEIPLSLCRISAMNFGYFTRALLNENVSKDDILDLVEQFHIPYYGGVYSFISEEEVIEAAKMINSNSKPFNTIFVRHIFRKLYDLSFSLKDN